MSRYIPIVRMLIVMPKVEIKTFMKIRLVYFALGMPAEEQTDRYHTKSI